MTLLKCCIQYASKFRKFSSGHRKRSVFIPITKKGNAKECSNYCTIALISHTSKVMFKILQARLQQYMNRISRCSSWIQKRQRIQRSSCRHPLYHRKNKRFPEKIYFCFIDYAKALDCVDHKLWKILKEMGTPDHHTCLLRNLYTGQEATLRTGHGTDCFQIRKGVC